MRTEFENDPTACFAVAVGVLLAFVGTSAATVLHDNGSMITNPGAGFNGADVSQTSANVTTLGFGSSTGPFTGVSRCADDFIVPAGGWRVSSATGFVYIVSAYPTFPPASPVASILCEIWNGPPTDNGPSIVIASSTTIIGNSWTGIYRTAYGAPNLTSDMRPIMALTADFGDLELAAGTYWISFNFNGVAPNDSTGCATSMVMSTDGAGEPVTVTGNGRRFVSSNWREVSTGSPVQGVEFPFIIDGSVNCGSADFDGDGDTGTDADIEAFFACLGGNCCGTCGSADFDRDGDTGTDADIEAFFRVLGGGTC